MKHLALILAATATVAFSLAAFTAGDLAYGRVAPAAAQAGPGGPQGGQGSQGGRNFARGRQQFAKMLLSLNLSEGQKSQIRTIMANARAKNTSLNDPQAKRDTMRGAFKNIEAVLTPAQQSKLQAERADYFKAHGGPAGGGNLGGGKPGGS